MWCYRRMLKIKYRDHVTNRKVREIMGMDMKYNWGTELAKRKMKYAGHLLRGSAGEFQLKYSCSGYWDTQGNNRSYSLEKPWRDKHALIILLAQRGLVSLWNSSFQKVIMPIRQKQQNLAYFCQ